MKVIKEWISCQDSDIKHARRWCFISIIMCILAASSNFFESNYVIGVGFLVWSLFIIFYNLCEFSRRR